MADTPIPPSATYNQRYGGDPLPAAMNPGELNTQVRIKMEELLLDFITRHSYGYAGNSNERFFGREHRGVKASMMSVLGAYYNRSKHEYRDMTYESLRAEVIDNITNGEVKNTLTFVEYFLDEYPDFTGDVKKILQDYSAPFFLLIDQGHVRFHPFSLRAEGESVTTSFKILNDFGFSGAAKHLLDASASLNRNEYAGCVRDSIHAVESVAKNITGDDKATLGKALNQLEEQGLEIHPALKGAFSRIYGYTSDEGGIRHALLDEHAKVDQNLAMFMFGACASFAAYLVNENRKRSQN